MDEKKEEVQDKAKAEEPLEGELSGEDMDKVSGGRGGGWRYVFGRIWAVLEGGGGDGGGGGNAVAGVRG